MVSSQAGSALDVTYTPDATHVFNTHGHPAPYLRKHPIWVLLETQHREDRTPVPHQPQTKKPLRSYYNHRRRLQRWPAPTDCKLSNPFQHSQSTRLPLIRTWPVSIPLLRYNCTVHTLLQQTDNVNSKSVPRLSTALTNQAAHTSALHNPCYLLHHPAPSIPYRPLRLLPPAACCPPRPPPLPL